MYVLGIYSIQAKRNGEKFKPKAVQVLALRKKGNKWLRSASSVHWLPWNTSARFGFEDRLHCCLAESGIAQGNDTEGIMDFSVKARDSVKDSKGDLSVPKSE
jgi:hypothetical protein